MRESKYRILIFLFLVVLFTSTTATALAQADGAFHPDDLPAEAFFYIDESCPTHDIIYEIDSEERVLAQHDPVGTITFAYDANCNPLTVMKFLMPMAQ